MLLGARGRRRLPAAAPAAGADAEGDQVLAREPEARTQVVGGAGSQVVALPLHGLAPAGELPRLLPRPLLLLFQLAGLHGQGLEPVVEGLEVRHRLQVRLQVGRELLPGGDLAGNNVFTLYDSALLSSKLRWTVDLLFCC